MKQSTIVDKTTFQTITTLETKCCRCHAITRHVAQATPMLPYDNGIFFNGDQTHQAFISFNKIIEQQSHVMNEMDNSYKCKIVELHQRIHFLEEVIRKFPAQSCNIEDDI